MTRADIKVGVRLWIAARRAADDKDYATLMATECEATVKFVAQSASPRRKSTSYVVLETSSGTFRADVVEVIDENTKRTRLHIWFRSASNPELVDEDTPEYVVMAFLAETKATLPASSEYPTID